MPATAGTQAGGKVLVFLGSRFCGNDGWGTSVPRAL